MANGVNWTYGAKEEDYPTDFWDDFDGKIESIEYMEGEYGAQVQVFVRPEGYEYEAENTEPPAEDDTEGLPRDWWGMGRKEYDFSDDGFKVLSGPAPSRNTNAAKGFIALTQALGGDPLPPDLSGFNQGEQTVLHWKRVKQEHTIRGEKQTSERMYPAGPAVGKPVDSKGVKQERSGRAAASTSKQEQKPEVEVPVAKEDRSLRTASKRASSSNGRRSSSAAPAATSGSPKPSKDEAVEVLVNLVGEFGDDGIRRSLLQTALVERKDSIPVELAKEVAKRATIKAALDAGQIEDEDGVLYKASE